MIVKKRSENDFLYPGIDAGETIPTIEMLRDELERCLKFAQAGAAHPWPDELADAIAVADATIKKELSR